MSTNFYWYVNVPKCVVLPTGETIKVEVDRHDPRYHIGKRSHAGFYCYDCNLKIGRQEDSCKKCGAILNIEGSPARASCNFSWAQDPGKVRSLCAELGGTKLVEDEYGVCYTGAEFLSLLTSLAEEHVVHIGERFG